MGLFYGDTLEYVLAFFTHAQVDISFLVPGIFQEEHKRTKLTTALTNVCIFKMRESGVKYHVYLFFFYKRNLNNIGGRILNMI